MAASSPASHWAKAPRKRFATVKASGEHQTRLRGRPDPAHSNLLCRSHPPFLLSVVAMGCSGLRRTWSIGWCSQLKRDGRKKRGGTRSDYGERQRHNPSMWVEALTRTCFTSQDTGEFVGYVLRTKDEMTLAEGSVCCTAHYFAVC